jgi:hypothetical protein
VRRRLEEALDEQLEAQRVSTKVEESLRAEVQMLTHKLVLEKRDKDRAEKSEAGLKSQVDALTASQRGVAVALRNMLTGMSLKVLYIYIYIYIYILPLSCSVGCARFERVSAQLYKR